LNKYSEWILFNFRRINIVIMKLNVENNEPIKLKASKYSCIKNIIVLTIPKISFENQCGSSQGPICVLKKLRFLVFPKCNLRTRKRIF